MPTMSNDSKLAWMNATQLAMWHLICGYDFHYDAESAIRQPPRTTYIVAGGELAMLDHREILRLVSVYQNGATRRLTIDELRGSNQAVRYFLNKFRETHLQGLFWRPNYYGAAWVRLTGVRIVQGRQTCEHNTTTVTGLILAFQSCVPHAGYVHHGS